MGFWEKLFGKKKETAAAEEASKSAREKEERVPVSRKPVIEEYDPAEFEIQGTVLVKHHQLPRKTVVVIPKGVTEIARNAFSACNVKKITVPDTVKLIRAYGLHVGSKLKEVIILGEDVALEQYALGYFNKDVYTIEGSKTWERLERRESMNWVKLHGYVADAESEDSGLFVEDGNTIKKAPKVTYPSHLVVPSVLHGKKIKRIEDLKGLNNVRILEFSEGIEMLLGISGCGKVTEIRLPSTMKQILKSSFCDCADLEELVFPEGLEEIGWGCFNGCAKLRRVVFPDSIRSIGGASFNNCPVLEEVILPERPFENRMFNKGRESFMGSPWRASLPEKWIRSGELLRDPDCQGEEYTVPAGVTVIGADAFMENKTIRKLVLGDEVKVIRTGAFSGTQISEISFGKELRELGEYAFSGCENLKEVDLPRGLTEVTGVYSGCKSLRRVTIPEGVVKIGSSAFSGCESLQEVSLPKGLTEIGSSTFGGCTSLAHIEIPATVKEIGMGAFDKTALTVVRLPADVSTTLLEKYVFPEQTSIWVGNKLFRKGKESSAAGQSDSKIKNEYKLSDTVTLALEKGYYYTEQKPDDGDDGDKSLFVSGSIGHGKYKDEDSGETKYRDDVTFTLIGAPEKDVPFEDIGFIDGTSVSGDLPDTKFVVMTVPVTVLGFTITSHVFECVRKMADGSFLDLRDAITLNSSADEEKEVGQELDYMLKVLRMFRENGAAVDTGSLTGKKLWKKLQKADKEAEGKKKKKAKKAAAGSGDAPLTFSGNTVNVDRGLYVQVPDGMKWSVDRKEIGDNKVLSCYKEEMNAYYLEEMGELEEDLLDLLSFSIPFSAPEAFTVQEGMSFGSVMDFSKKELADEVRELADSSLGGVIDGELVSVRETDDLMIFYKNSGAQTMYCIATPYKVYPGQIWINDADDPVPYVNSILSRVTWADRTEGEDAKQTEFVLPTYKEKKTCTVGGLFVPVPDQLVSLDAVDGSDKDLNLEGLASNYEYSVLNDKYLFLAISKEKNKGFSRYRDAYCSIIIRKDSIQRDDSLAELWDAGKETKRRDQIKDWLCSNFGEDISFQFRKLGAKLDAAYFQANEGEDHGAYWCTYFVLMLHDDTLYQVNIFFNAKENQALFEKAVDDWISRISEGDAGNAEAMHAELRKQALGPYAGKNGKADAIEVSRLFSQDVLFFNDSDLKYDGKHHKAVGMQMNAEKTEEYGWITENLTEFGPEVIDLLSYVEQNDNLMIPKKKIHEDLLPMTRNDPATGITFMDFCAWHLLLFAVKDETKHEYMCMVEPNLINGIPNAYDYIAEFLKTLLAYNGYTGDFSFNAVLTVSMDLMGNRIHDPVPGAARAESFKTIQVKGN